MRSQIFYALHLFGVPFRQRNKSNSDEFITGMLNIFSASPPPWASNSWANRKYGLIDPNAAIGRCIAAYNRRKNGHPWGSILKR
jgi:hypothetical protein